jgi:hypothetical protein
MYTTTASIAAYTAQTYGVTYTEKGMYMANRHQDAGFLMLVRTANNAMASV